MRDTRRKTLCWGLRWSAKELPCCVVRLLSADREGIGHGLCRRADSFYHFNQTLTTSVADRLRLTVSESRCGEQSVPSSPNIGCIAKSDPFQLFLNSSAPHPITPKQKALLVSKDVIDPFNILTSGGVTAISMAASANAPYGPGVKGWARLSGISFTQGMTYEYSTSSCRKL